LPNLNGRVLLALSDSKERHITAVCLVAECSHHEIHNMAEAGLLRSPDVLAGGKRVQITPKGLELLIRYRKAEGARK
jgi:hypothetical protein